MSKTVSEILSAAADLIEPEGAWTQEEWALGLDGEADPIGPAQCWCAWGAIYEVEARRWTPNALQAVFVAESVADHLRDPSSDGRHLQVWNDAPERTQSEVVAKLREAAEKAREQGL